MYCITRTSSANYGIIIKVQYYHNMIMAVKECKSVNYRLATERRCHLDSKNTLRDTTIYPSNHFCPAGRPVVAGDTLMVLGHHLILDIEWLQKQMIGFNQLRAPAISKNGKVREPVKSENLSSFLSV